MAKQYVSFDEVKARVTMEQVLEHYGLLDGEVKRKGDELILHCIFHEHDKTPSLKINTAKNIFNCFGCNQGGDVIGFVVLKEGIETGEAAHDRREAALLLQEWFKLTPKRSSKARRRATASSSTTPTAEKAAPASAQEHHEPAQPARDGENAGVVNPPLTFSL